MLVVGQAAQDRARAEIGQAAPLAQQRQQHFRIEEAATVEQREDEVDVGRAEQRFIAVGQVQIDADLLHHRAHFAMIGRVRAVGGVEATLPMDMLGDQHDLQGAFGRRGKRTGRRDASHSGSPDPFEARGPSPTRFPGAGHGHFRPGM
jgi:hypothetical protein